MRRMADPKRTRSAAEGAESPRSRHLKGPYLLRAFFVVLRTSHGDNKIMTNNWLYLACGGLLGTFARYGVSQTASRFLGVFLPWGTFIVNILGCLAAGYFMTQSGGRIVANERERLLLLTGFCGAFTTFSALLFDVYGLLKTDQPVKAFLYITASLLVGLLAFAWGARLGSRF